MQLIGDFHIHGAFAQACSRNTTLKLLEDNAKIKGLNILGTGDCLHPKWHNNITSELKEDENGILWSKSNFPFIWQTEISLIYSQGGKGRRIHHIILFPDRETVKQARDEFLKIGRLDYDGRPIFGISSIELVEKLMSINNNIEIIPAHAWTSWFAIFGSKSGFDSVKECFQEKAKYIHAIETGLSSDPLMNRRVSSLDNYNLVSFSDPHTYFPWRLGREATIFDCDIKYKSIINSIRTGSGLKSTIEVDPAYGKYHEDGHRVCNIHLNYKKSKELNGICPKCRKPLTLGVEYRVEELADRSEPKNPPEFKKLIPLTELISKIYGIKLLGSKKIWEVYNTLIKNFNTEYNILLNVEAEELEKVIHTKLVSLIIKNRNQELNLLAGYDGVYGEIVLDDKETIGKQKSLNEF